MRHLEKKDRSEVRSVKLDIVTDLDFGPNLPDAPKSAPHGGNDRDQIGDVSQSAERPERFRRFLMEQSRQSQTLDLVEITTGSRLDPPVNVADVLEERHAKVGKPTSRHGRRNDGIRATLPE
jgi:hypothetical protein